MGSYETTKAQQHKSNQAVGLQCELLHQALENPDQGELLVGWLSTSQSLP